MPADVTPADGQSIWQCVVTSADSPDGRLGYGAVEQYCKTSVQTENAMGAHCLPHTVGNAIVFLGGSRLLIQLQLSLDELGGERDTDLYTASQTTWKQTLAMSI